jgi:hypothetical protein
VNPLGFCSVANELRFRVYYYPLAGRETADERMEFEQKSFIFVVKRSVSEQRFRVSLV